jgi:methionine sulfoxide reductase heme-binding subunit
MQRRRLPVPWRDRNGRFSRFRTVCLLGCIAPGAVIFYWLVTGTFADRPIHTTLQWIGLWNIRFIVMALAITPFASVLDWPKLLLVRRMVGVTAAVYVLVHFILYVAYDNWRLPMVASEVVLRFYLSIGFVALLGLLALAATSTDAVMRRMGRGWKRLHRSIYLIAALALLHYFIQSKANVSEPVVFAGLFVWLMLWRLVRQRWRRSLAIYPVLSVLAAISAAWIEFAWYGLATRINPWRVLAASETLRFGLRPAHWVLIATMLIGVVAVACRIGRRRSPFTQRVARAGAEV